MKKSVVLLLLILSSFVFAQTWVKVSCGGEFTIALRSDGTMWAWGFNGNGQLGLGSIMEQHAPMQVGTDNDWSDIAAGGYHTIAVKTDGTLWGCGFNVYGMVGDGTKQDRRVFVKIGNENDWSTVKASFVNSYAIKTDGSLYAWGNNSGFQLGDSLIAESLVPKRVGTASNWSKISAGALHVIGLRTDGTLWAWGANPNGELGMPGVGETIAKAQQITGGTWTAIATGFQFSAALRSDNTLWTWGYNGNGQLGHSGSTASSNIPKQVEGTTWATLAAGPSWVHATQLDGSLWGWGFNGAGQLGTSVPGPTEPILIAQNFGLIMMAPATGIYVDNTVFGAHSIAIRGNGTFLCGAGANYVGQLGLGAPSGSLTEFDCTIGKLSVSEEIAARSLVIYPNPAGDVVTISMPGAQTLRVELVDLLGNVVASAVSQTSDYTFDLGAIPGLSSATYHVRASGITEDKNEFRYNRKLQLIRK